MWPVDFFYYTFSAYSLWCYINNEQAKKNNIIFTECAKVSGHEPKTKVIKKFIFRYEFNIYFYMKFMSRQWLEKKSL